VTVITPPGLLPGGERVERVIDGIGTLVYEDYGPGQWLTQKGTPAKRSRRRYLLDGETLDSVSSIVDAHRKEGLERWKEEMGARGGVRAERLGELVGVPEEEIIARVRFLELGADAKAGEASDRGKAIHAAMERLARGEAAPDPATFPALARPWLQGAIRAWLALGVTDVVAVEEIVCFPEHNYAGRPDLVCITDRGVTLADYKTGRGKIYDTSHYQVRLYAMALARLGVVVDRIVLIGVDDSGGFELIDCAASVKAAEALLTVSRATKFINSDMAAQRRIAEAA
jgi:hypothetical protein